VVEQCGLCFVVDVNSKGVCAFVCTSPPGALAPTFSLVGHGSSDFSMEPETGIISTAKKLDRESIPFYNLIGYAEDRESGEACQVEIRVKVLDENDNEPR